MHTPVRTCTRFPHITYLLKELTTRACQHPFWRFPAENGRCTYSTRQPRSVGVGTPQPLASDGVTVSPDQDAPHPSGRFSTTGGQ